MRKKFAMSSFIVIAISVPVFVQGARLYFTPQSQEVYQGDTFVSEMRLDTEGENINAIDVRISFPAALVAVADITTGGSLFSLYPTEPAYSNEEGIISFGAGIPNGFSGEGIVGTIFFRSKEKGFATIRFLNDSRVFLHDGRGTLTDVTVSEAAYHIAEKPEDLVVVSSQSHPDQDTWYPAQTIHLMWEIKEGASYSYRLSRNLHEVPDAIPEEPVGDIVLMTEGDSIFYFHLRECFFEVCGPPVTRTILKDTTPPEFSDVFVAQDPTVFEGRTFLAFLATDRTSGIDHYEVAETKEGKRKMQDQRWKNATSPWLLKDQRLKSIITVRAIDKAGNESIVFLPAQNPTKRYQKHFVFGIIGIIGIVVVYVVVRLKKKSVPT